jgi:hypothetical protein
MANDDNKYIRLPIWFAAIIMSLILAVASDTWRTVNQVKTDLAILKTALAVKGIIDPKLVHAGQETAKLSRLRGNPDNSANTPN